MEQSNSPQEISSLPVVIDEDIALVAKYQKGEQAALNTLLLKYQKPLYNFIWRKTNNISIADEILQELSLKIFENIKRFSPARQGSFRKWVYQIALNLCYDHFRYKQKVKTMEGELKDRQAKQMMSHENPASAAMMAEEMLAQLPDEQKEVVLLKIYSGLTFREIADITECPLNTVISRMHYALKLLRKKIK